MKPVSASAGWASAGDADGGYGLRRDGAAGTCPLGQCLGGSRPSAYEIPLRQFERFRKHHPRAGERIMRNLAQLLAERLLVANAKVELLTAG
jgi:hypothetical protein